MSNGRFWVVFGFGGVACVGFVLVASLLISACFHCNVLHFNASLLWTWRLARGTRPPHVPLPQLRLAALLAAPGNAFLATPSQQRLTALLVGAEASDWRADTRPPRAPTIPFKWVASLVWSPPPRLPMLVSGSGHRGMPFNCVTPSLQLRQHEHGHGASSSNSPPTAPPHPHSLSSSSRAATGLLPASCGTLRA